MVSFQWGYWSDQNDCRVYQLAQKEQAAQDKHINGKYISYWFKTCQDSDEYNKIQHPIFNHTPARSCCRVHKLPNLVTTGIRADRAMGKQYLLLHRYKGPYDMS